MREDDFDNNEPAATQLSAVNLDQQDEQTDIAGEPAGGVRLRIADYDSPMDLLSDLIDRNRFSILDIPIAEITGQYLDHLRDMSELDMDLASDFLVMAATLLHIKSKTLLPDSRLTGQDDEPDPREELVLQLIEYRRCKLIAAELSDRQDHHYFTLLKLPETPRTLGLRCGNSHSRIPLNRICFGGRCRLSNCVIQSGMKTCPKKFRTCCDEKK